jgi:predicted lipid carrier protein YhbT
MMTAQADYSSETEKQEYRYLPRLLRLILAPVPLFVIQPALYKIVHQIAQKRPALFDRIGPHKDKLFLIDPVNLPFAFALRPNPDNLSFRAYRRRNLPQVKARIAGTFLTLLDMVDGQLDGDALFFTRELVVEGDTEAVVCLRNAIDDIEGSIAEDTANLFGFSGRNALKILRKARNHGREH